MIFLDFDGTFAAPLLEAEIFLQRLRRHFFAIKNLWMGVFLICSLDWNRECKTKKTFFVGEPGP